eukprot:695945-Pleurochrysis_carterae.AAC.1
MRRATEHQERAWPHARMPNIDADLKHTHLPRLYTCPQRPILFRQRPPTLPTHLHSPASGIPCTPSKAGPCETCELPDPHLPTLHDDNPRH